MSFFARDYSCNEGKKSRDRERERKAESYEKRLKINDMQILSKDTSNMNTRQLQVYEFLCDTIRKNMNLIDIIMYFGLN